MSDRIYRKYDHRLRNLIVESGDADLFPELNIPSSTIRDWFKKGSVEVVTTSALTQSHDILALNVLRLEKENSELRAEKNLFSQSVKICGFTVQYKRLPTEELKTEILVIVKQALQFLSLRACLELIGLSSARYHHWIRKARKCSLKDLTSCPNSTPTRLTSAEIGIAKELILDPDYSHYSITSLSWFAKKTGKLFASPATWSRIVRQYNLRRPGKRQYPLKPKIGIRASKPGQIWHLDMSVIKLVDNTRCYIQAIIDNYSRYVLAWNVTKDYGGQRTKELLLNAISHSKSLNMPCIPDVFVDSGTENLNSHVDSLVNSDIIKRVVAQIDVEFSNSSGSAAE